MAPITLLLIAVSVLSVQTQDVVLSRKVVDDLRGVVVLCNEDFPYLSYRTDPHLPWIEERRQAQLSIEGRHSHYELGRWLRGRYDGFLPRVYNHRDIFVRSADAERPVISAQAVVRGLYHTEDIEERNTIVNWQPIPVQRGLYPAEIPLRKNPVPNFLQAIAVERLPYIEESVLLPPRTCPRHNLLFDRLHETVGFRRVHEEYREIIDHISYHTGEPITGLQDLARLHDVFYAQECHNLPLPPWAGRVYPYPLRQFRNWYHGLHTYTPELARLRTGRLLYDVVDHFDQLAVRPDVPRLALYSGVNLGHIVNTLGINHEILPGPGQLVFELRGPAQDPYLNTFYRRDGDLIPLNLRNPFGPRCSLPDFRTLVNPFRIDGPTWARECNKGL